VLAFDEAVRSERRMGGVHWESEVRRLRFARDGGTAYGPLFERATELAPSALVVLTDLEADLPPAPGRLRVIWAAPRPPRQAPRFGTLVTLDR
jgi:hypothetical protein